MKLLVKSKFSVFCTVFCVSLLMIDSPLAQHQKKSEINANRKQIIDFNNLATNQESRDTSLQISNYHQQAGALSSDIVSIDTARTRERESRRQSYSDSSSGSSGSSTINSSKTSGVASIREQSHDNAGRKTEGYWIKCSGGREIRVYRTAWETTRDWYEPNGMGTNNFLGKGNLTINDIAKKICG